jgi:hypothetical protein
LVGPDGGAPVAVVGIDLNISGTDVHGAPVSVHRRGDLTMVNEAGAWKIDAFQFTVDREMP